LREKTVEWALKEKIIAIVRGMEAKDCLRVAQALYDGGIRLMEITYDQRDPAQWAKTADAIGKIAEAFEGRMLVGAGTVTTPAFFSSSSANSWEVLPKALILGKA